jgi:KaiC/GvpD/RAD55 family RecA-like ATPase
MNFTPREPMGEEQSLPPTESTRDAVIYSRGANISDNTPATHTAENFDEFQAAVLADRSPRKGMTYIASAFDLAPDVAAKREKGVVGKTHRCADGAQCTRILAFDCDKVDGPDAQDALFGWIRRRGLKGFGYSTASHTDELPRLRIFMEADRQMNRAERITASEEQRAEFVKELGDRFGFDSALDRPEQPIYTPTTGAQVFVFDGEPIKVDALLARRASSIVNSTHVGNTSKPPLNRAPLATAISSALSVTPDVIADLRSALEYVLSDNRDTWIRVACALHSLGEPGYILWLEWSQRSQKWKDSDTEVWGTLEHSRTSYAAVFAEAQRCGWMNPSSAKAMTQAAAAAAHRFTDDFMAAPTLMASAAPIFLTVKPGDLTNAAITPPRLAFGVWVPRGHTTLLGGHGGIGKSTFALTLAAHFACGRPFGEHTTDGGKVLVVTLEDNAELVRYRLSLIVDEFGLDAARVAEGLTILDGTCSEDSALAVEVNTGRVPALAATRAMVEVEAAARGAGLIIIDNGSDAYDANEIERRFVRKFVRQMLGKIARENDAGLILLVHIDKQAARSGANGNSYSGSTAWHNSARSRIALVENDGVIEARHEKANLSAKAPTLRLALTASGVLVPVASGASSSVDTAHDDALLQCLTAAIANGETISTGRAGPGNTHTHAKSLPGFPAHLKPSARFWQALGRLSAASWIEREEYTNHSRNKRERWKVSSVSFVASSGMTTANQHTSATRALVVQGYGDISTHAETDEGRAIGGLPTDSRAPYIPCEGAVH